MQGHSFRRGLFTLFVLAALALAAYQIWQRLHVTDLPPGFVAGNGRLEATEVDVATKVAGRLASVGPREGDEVVAGAEVARLDADSLNAQWRAAQSQINQAQAAIREARAGVVKAESDRTLAEKTLQRSQELVQKGFISNDKLDRDRSGVEAAAAALNAARQRVGEADAAQAAAVANAEALHANVADTALRAPISGRVLYRLAEPGEVLAAGGKVLTLLDLGDVFMTIYLPTADVGRISLGAPARILLDALPEEPIPARVVFVAPKAQFTPREVETRNERDKLMFRVKVKVDEAWIAQHRELFKAGMPGVAYLPLAPNLPWPAKLTGGNPVSAQAR